jgi:hypothetical protein
VRSLEGETVQLQSHSEDNQEGRGMMKNENISFMPGSKVVVTGLPVASLTVVADNGPFLILRNEKGHSFRCDKSRAVPVTPLERDKP